MKGSGWILQKKICVLGGQSRDMQVVDCGMIKDVNGPPITLFIQRRQHKKSKHNLDNNGWWFRKLLINLQVHSK